MHRHWEDGWERRNEVTGWELGEKKREERVREKEKKKEQVEKIGNWSVSDDLSKSRERLISYIVLSQELVWNRLNRCTLFVARVFEFGRFAAKCLEKFNLPGNVLRGASRKPVEPDKLVIEQRIFLSFSGGGGSTVCPARPDRSRGQSCPIYKKRQQLLRPPRINIGYVSELTYRARQIPSLFRSVFLLGAVASA